jgi:hypothetical protein
MKMPSFTALCHLASSLKKVAKTRKDLTMGSTKTLLADRFLRRLPVLRTYKFDRKKKVTSKPSPRPRGRPRKIIQEVTHE